MKTFIQTQQGRTLSAFVIATLLVFLAFCQTRERSVHRLIEAIPGATEPKGKTPF